METVSDPKAMEYLPFARSVLRWRGRLPEGKIPTTPWSAEDDELCAFRLDVALQAEPLSVAYTHAGKAIELLYGKPLKGQQLDTLYNEWFRRQAYKSYTFMLQHQLPVYERRTFSVISGKLGYHKLLLPFGDGGITRAISYVIPIDPKIKNRAAWQSIIEATPWLFNENIAPPAAVPEVTVNS